MLELIKLKLENNILTADILIEGDQNRRYAMTFDLSGKVAVILKSDVPDEYRIYERQAMVALDYYIGKELPEKITGMWY